MSVFTSSGHLSDEFCQSGHVTTWIESQMTFGGHVVLLLPGPDCSQIVLMLSPIIWGRLNIQVRIKKKTKTCYHCSFTVKPFIWNQFGQGKMWHCWGRHVASVTWRKVTEELVKDDTSLCLGKVGTWSLEQGFSCLGRWVVRNIPALRGFFIMSNCSVRNLMRAKHGTVHHCVSSDVVIGALSLSFILILVSTSASHDRLHSLWDNFLLQNQEWPAVPYFQRAFTG